MSIDYTQKIPNNVDLAGDRHVQAQPGAQLDRGLVALVDAHGLHRDHHELV